MVGDLIKRLFNGVVLLLALLMFFLVPLGKKTAAQHVIAIFSTKPAKEAAQAVSIQPMAYGADTGRRMAPTDAVEPLSQSPERPIVAAAGDMGAMCNIGEFETAMRENIPVVLVVFNDQGLGNERAFQQAHYGGRLFAVDYRNPDFGALARAFGAHGEKVSRPQELEGALQRALAAGKPALVEVEIDQNTLAPVVFKA